MLISSYLRLLRGCFPKCQKKQDKIQEAEASFREAEALYEEMGLPALIDLFETMK